MLVCKIIEGETYLHMVLQIGQNETLLFVGCIGAIKKMVHLVLFLFSLSFKVKTVCFERRDKSKSFQ